MRYFFCQIGKNNQNHEVYTANYILKCYSNCKENIFFIHAFTGCEAFTTSAFHCMEKEICIDLSNPNVYSRGCSNFQKENLRSDEDKQKHFQAGFKYITQHYTV